MSKGAGESGGCSGEGILPPRNPSEIEGGSVDYKMESACLRIIAFSGEATVISLILQNLSNSDAEDPQNPVK